MFKEATAQVFGLLDTSYAYPRAMILEFAKADPEATRQMFRELYDEPHDLAERVETFQAAAESLRTLHDDGTSLAAKRCPSCVASWIFRRRSGAESDVTQNWRAPLTNYPKTTSIIRS